MTTALVVGLGAAGRRHAEALKACRPDMRVVGVSRTRDTVPHVDVVVPHLEVALAEEPALAVLAGPASSRMDAAVSLAGAGVHLLLEKPVAVNLSQVQPLVDLATTSSVTIAVGYNLRFYPPLCLVKDLIEKGAIGALRGARVEVGQHLADWRPGRDHRGTVSAQRALGGGALLELSHELDYVRWILGEPTSVWATLARLGLDDLDVEDTAELVVTFASGAIASIHQDMLQRPAVRTGRFVGEGGSITADLLGGSVTLDAVGEESKQVGDAATATVALTYRAQMEDFLAAVGSSRPPRVPFEQGVRTLALAVAARQAAAEGRTVATTARDGTAG